MGIFVFAGSETSFEDREMKIVCGNSFVQARVCLPIPAAAGDLRARVAGVTRSWPWLCGENLLLSLTSGQA
jgi:hypothetical protein